MDRMVKLGKGIGGVLLVGVVLILLPSGVCGGEERILHWEWDVPALRIEPLPDGVVTLGIDGYDVLDEPGLPRLPFKSVLIALPPGVDPELRVDVLETEVIDLDRPLAVAPRVDGVVWGEEGVPLGPRLVLAFDPTRFPLEHVALEEAGFVQGVRLGRVVFYPVLFVGGQLRLVRRVRVEVRWPAGDQTSEGVLPAGLEVIRRMVMNAVDVHPSEVSPRPLPHLRPLGGSRRIALEISQPGVYQIDYDQLVQYGMALTPVHLHLFRGNDEVAYEWVGDGDATFEPGEAIRFYAEPRFSRWSRVDVYWLCFDEQYGVRMESRSADPSGLSLGVPWIDHREEENRLYAPNQFIPGIPLGRDGDRWMWDDLIGPGDGLKEYPFVLQAVDERQPGRLIVWAIGYTSSSHCWRVTVNGYDVGEIEWSGKTAITATLELPAGVLRDGVNQLGLTSLVTSGTWLDAFVVLFARSQELAGGEVVFWGAEERRRYTVGLEGDGPYLAYDVSDPLHPVRLEDIQVVGREVSIGDPPEGGIHRYFVVDGGSIRSPDRIRAPEDVFGFHVSGGGGWGGDYLIITHPEFVNALAPLIALRDDQGLEVRVANVLGIYDVYGDGRVDPEAIRAFLSEVYATWDPRPRYVLLVGDGSYDSKRYLSSSPPTYIPPYLADVDVYGGETAADNRYVCVDGDDRLPDMILGRLPVGSVEEAVAVVQKIVAYETDPLPGGWNARVVLVADDADAGGDFPAMSEVAAKYVGDPFQPVQRYCVGSEPYQSDCPADRADEVHAELMGDWMQGGLLFQYTGHSSWQQWAVERLLHLDDLEGLANARRYPVLAEMTCFTGAFHRPEATLDEELVEREGGGAVAVWGPTGLGLGAGHEALSQGFFRAVFSDTVPTVGEAMLAGQLSLLAKGQHLELLDTYVLLGDPALRWNRTLVPWTSQVYLPFVGRAWSW